MNHVVTALLVLQSLSYGTGVFESSPHHGPATVSVGKLEIDASASVKVSPKSDEIKSKSLSS